MPTVIGDLVQLQIFSLSCNKLTSLPSTIGNMVQLRTLWVNSNMLTDIPLNIIYLQNMTNFTYYDNEITNLHPAIIRWLNRPKTIQNVYDNSQSVHDCNIESSANASIIKFVSNHKVNNIDVFDLIDGFNINDQTKNLLKEYCASDYIHSNLKLNFSEVALPVLDYINNHQNKQDLLIILQDEIGASRNRCFQGRLSRLINVINGYCPDISINISSNEQIGNIIIMLKSRCNDLDQIVKLFVQEMNERGYEQSVVDEWTVYIRENY
jgi:hypothetical protein